MRTGIIGTKIGEVNSNIPIQSMNIPRITSIPIIVKTIPIGSKGNPKIKLFRYAVPPIILNTPIKLVEPIVNQNNLPVTLKV